MTTSGEERGFALITVLLLLSTLGLLAAAAVTHSLGLSRVCSGAERRAFASYRAESALNRAIWLLKQDVAAHTIRTLGELDYDAPGSDLRFPADGVERTMTVQGAAVPVTINDAAGGFPLDPAETLTCRMTEFRQAALSGERRSLDEEKRFQRLIGRVNDFFDADSFRDIDGFERDDYRRAGRAHLPRNGRPEFREEMLWIPDGGMFFAPDADEVFRGVAPLPPEGMPPVPEEVRLYSSPVDRIGVALELTGDERAELAEALTLWRTRRRPLSRTLNRALYDRIAESDAVVAEESGLYRIETGGGDGIRLTATFRLERGANFLEFYEYFLY